MFDESDRLNMERQLGSMYPTLDTGNLVVHSTSLFFRCGCGCPSRFEGDILMAICKGFKTWPLAGSTTWLSRRLARISSCSGSPSWVVARPSEASSGKGARQMTSALTPFSLCGGGGSPGHGPVVVAGGVVVVGVVVGAGNVAPLFACLLSAWLRSK